MKTLILTFFLFSCAHQHVRSIEENRQGIEKAQEEITSHGVVDRYESKDGEVEHEMLAVKEDTKYSLSLLGSTPEAFSFISLLKLIDEKKIKLTGLSGRGMGALVAALYSKYGKANMVEWIIFKYLDRFFPYQQSFESEFKKTLSRLINKEFRKTKTSKFKYEFKVNSTKDLHAYLEKEVLGEDYTDRYFFGESVCVYESQLYPEDINLCFFSSSKESRRVDDIDRKSFALKWHTQSDLPLVDVILEKESQLRKMVKGL